MKELGEWYPWRGPGSLVPFPLSLPVQLVGLAVHELYPFIEIGNTVSKQLS